MYVCYYILLIFLFAVGLMSVIRICPSCHISELEHVLWLHLDIGAEAEFLGYTVCFYTL